MRTTGRRLPAVDHFLSDVQMSVTVCLPAPGTPFQATLVRTDLRWFDDDPEPDITELPVCERSFAVPLPELFAAVDSWLCSQHRLRVLPHSWTPCDAGGDTGCALLLEGRALPAMPISGPLGHWG